MCGRFTLFTPASRFAEVFLPGEILSMTPRYNIAPSQTVLVVRAAPAAGRREFAMTRWGLIPSWAKETIPIGNRLINARAETVSEKPAFHRAFREHRCLVPTDGFYEWARSSTTRKQPFYIRMRDELPFAFAGLWERWESPDEGAIETCTILTTAANACSRPDPRSYAGDPVAGALRRVA